MCARLSPAGEGAPHFGFRLDPERVGDAVDVIEIADHFHGVEDVAVGEAVLAQGRDIPAPDFGGPPGHQFREFRQCFFAR